MKVESQFGRYCSAFDYTERTIVAKALKIIQFDGEF